MVSEAISSDVGAYLRNWRRSKDIPLEEVAQRTKIRTIVLRQVEGEELNRIPSTFAKGFIRAYAEAVGADVQEALQRYEEGCKSHPRTEQHQPASPQRPRTVFWRRFLPMVVVFIGLILATVYLAGRPHRGEKPSKAVSAAVHAQKVRPRVAPAAPAAPAGHPAQSNITSETKEAVNSARPEPAGGADKPEQKMPKVDEAIAGQPTSQPAAAVSSAQPDHANAGPNAAASTGPNAPAPAAQPTLASQSPKLVLQLNAVALTWLRISQDGGPPKEMTLRPDDHVTLQAQKKFDLLIGNAGGIRLKLNDQPVKISNVTGKVIRLELP